MAVIQCAQHNVLNSVNLKKIQKRKRFDFFLEVEQYVSQKPLSVLNLNINSKTLNIGQYTIYMVGRHPNFHFIQFIMLPIIQRHF